jgi:hypothetical protein
MMMRLLNNPNQPPQPVSLNPLLLNYRSGKVKEKEEKPPPPFSFEEDAPPTSPLFRTATDYFSANVGLDDERSPFRETVAFTNLFSSDISKSVLNAWRQGLVDVTRRLDYGWRSVSQVPMQYLQEGFRRVARSQISPLFNAELFPKTDGQKLTAQDRSLYAHLNDKQFEELRAFDAKYCLDVEQMGDLYTALTDSSAGLRYKKIPFLLSYFNCEMEKKDAVTGKGTGQYETVNLTPNSALATHLKWKLAAEDTLATQAQYFDLLQTSAQHIPFMQYKKEEEHSVRAIGESVLKANAHLKQVGTLGQMPTVYQFLIQASRGDFTTPSQRNASASERLNLPLAFKVFTGGLQNEPISEELPMILGGEGSSLRKLDQLVTKTWLANLYYACEPADEKKANASSFGKPSPLEAVWKSLWKDLKQGVDDPTLEVFTQRVGRSIDKILSGKILLKYPDEKETVLSYEFKVDAKDRLGLKYVNGQQFVQESAAALWHLQKTVKQCNEMVNNQGRFENLTPQAFQAEAKKLLETYYEQSFVLATTLPGKNGDNLGALKNFVNTRMKTTAEQQEAEEKGAYQLLKLLCESNHLRQYRLPSLVKASAIPQLIATVATGLVVTGVVWNYLDNNVIQKYENAMVEKKGSVEYTGLVMAAGFVPAMAAFIAMLKMDCFKRMTGNRPHLHFGLVGAIALGLQAVLTVGLVRGFIALKPNMPKPKELLVPGAFTATAELNLANVKHPFLSNKPTVQALPQAVKPFVNNRLTLNTRVQSVPLLTAKALAQRYPFTAEALQ